MVVNLLIKIVNNSRAVYYPGQTVEAYTELFMTETGKVKEIYAEFKGQSRTSWNTGSVNSRESHIETEQYFKTMIPLFQATDGDYDDVQPGMYEYPVSFILPDLIPSSFEGKKGYVRYLIKAWLKMKGGAVYRVQYPFTVIYQLNLNTISRARLPTEMQDTKTGCCLCCKTGPVTCMMRLDKQGYVPGENIKINAEVTNNGSTPIGTITVNLVMTTTFRAYGSSTKDIKIVTSISHGGVGPGQSDIWSGDQLLVLSTPPSYLYGCSIIDIQYTCTLAADMDGSLLNINFELPIIIGTISLREELSPPSRRAVSYGRQSESNWRESGDGLRTDHVLLDTVGSTGPITSQPGHQPNAPPSYEECVTTDRVRIMRQNSNSADQGEEFTKFAPSYPYYKTTTV